MFGCAHCMEGNPEEARTRHCKFAPAGQLVEESHFFAYLKRCPECGQEFLNLFMELIDWSGGDDSQATAAVPVTAEESTILRGTSADRVEATIEELRINRRHLARSYPRGGVAETFWKDGELLILPHD